MRSMDRFVLFAAHGYALPILRPLQDAIRRRGGVAAWYLHHMPTSLLREGERRLESVAALVEFRPEAIFVPGNWVPQFVSGVKVEVFHGFAIEKKGHFAIRNWVDLYCTFGELTTAPFRELARRHGHFHVAETGWPKMDPLFRPESGPDWKATRHIDQPIVLYAPTFSPALTSAPELRETIRALSRGGGLHWVVKLHPKMDSNTVADYRGMAGGNLTFVEDSEIAPYLRAADVMLSDTSSTSTEFLLLGKPVVTFRTRRPAAHLMDIDSPRDLESALARARARPAAWARAAREFIARMHPYQDGRSSERVLDATEEFAERVAPTLRPKPRNLWRKVKVRRRLGYWNRPGSMHGGTSRQPVGQTRE